MSTTCFTATSGPVALAKTRFTATSGPVALATVLEAVKAFPYGDTIEPVPGCIMIVNLSDELDLTVGGKVSVLAAEHFEDFSDYFKFKSIDGDMHFNHLIKHEEDVKAMKKAVFDLIMAQHTNNLYGAPETRA